MEGGVFYDKTGDRMRIVEVPSPVLTDGSYEVPRTFGPFPIPERKRTFSPDDAKLFRLLCGLKGQAPAKMFRTLVRNALRAELGTVAKTNAARAAAERIFAKLDQVRS